MQYLKIMKREQNIFKESETDVLLAQLFTLCWLLHVPSRLPWRIDWQACCGSPCLCPVGPCHLPFGHHLGCPRGLGCGRSHDDHRCHSNCSVRCTCYQKAQNCKGGFYTERNYSIESEHNKITSFKCINFYLRDTHFPLTLLLPSTCLEFLMQNITLINKPKFYNLQLNYGCLFPTKV